MEPLFQPFRALGYIADATPCVLHKRGKTNFAIVSVGKAWQIFDCRKLTLSLVGPNVRTLPKAQRMTLVLPLLESPARLSMKPTHDAAAPIKHHCISMQRRYHAGCYWRGQDNCCASHSDHPHMGRPHCHCAPDARPGQASAESGKRQVLESLAAGSSLVIPHGTNSWSCQPQLTHALCPFQQCPATKACPALEDVQW
jgi:hypothetical protein